MYIAADTTTLPSAPNPPSESAVSLYTIPKSITSISSIATTTSNNQSRQPIVSTAIDLPLALTAPSAASVLPQPVTRTVTSNITSSSTATLLAAARALPVATMPLGSNRTQTLYAHERKPLNITTGCQTYVDVYMCVNT